MGLLSKLKGQKSDWCTAVIVAAGTASRMNGTDKIMLELDGIPMLIRSIQPFQDSENIQEILVVTRADLLEQAADLCEQYRISKLSAVVVGGETRTDSVLHGLEQVDECCTLVAIHDGARPFVSRRIIDETVRCARANGAAAPAVSLKDTVKTAEKNVVTGTPDRETLCAVQTPQCFDKDLIHAALVKAKKDGITLTDDCSAAERMGMKVHLTKGGNQNIKITTPSDLWLADGILRGRAAYCESDTDTMSTD